MCMAEPTVFRRPSRARINNYLWGPRCHDGSLIILVNGDPNHWQRLCRDIEVVDTFGVPYAMPYETDRPISICRGLRADLSATWRRLKRYE